MNLHSTPRMKAGSSDPPPVLQLLRELGLLAAALAARRGAGLLADTTGSTDSSDVIVGALCRGIAGVSCTLSRQHYCAISIMLECAKL